MADLSTDFSTNFTAALDAITSSKIYTDMQAMYDNGRLQKNQHDKILIAFHEQSLTSAASLAENITIKGYRIDDIIQADLDVKTNQNKTEIERTALLKAQTKGFDDNVTIERVKIAAEAIGMIQSGGNEAPQEFFDEWTDAIADIRILSKNHSELATP